MKFHIEGNIVDLINRRIFPGSISVVNGKISSISQVSEKFDRYILPGLIDSHIHIESSMLPPSEFARIAVTHGTVATVSDPHEIANVLGVEGVNFMLENGKTVPMKFYFGAPSCVPATNFETAGGIVSSDDISFLLSNPEIKYLSEMMNFPGVIFDDEEVMKKIAIAKKFGKPVDGHAPGLRGDSLKKYIQAGITTDHECFTLEEALEKISLGMKILIREGSAAKNYSSLHELIDTHPDMVMLCSDDLHPDNLAEGHINLLIKHAIDDGHDLMNILQAACVNPVMHYNLDVGLLRPGDDADFIIIDNFNDFNILATFINGEKVAEKGKALFERRAIKSLNKFEAKEKLPSDFIISAKGKRIRVIEALSGELITNEISADEYSRDGNIISDIENNILKIAVVNRYQDTKPAVGFIKNIGISRGAFASSVAHDSHNIIAVGISDEELCKAVNRIIKNRGGLDVVDRNYENVLPLPIAGLMSDSDGYETAAKYSELQKKVKELGSKLDSPFMTLSFMALLVIPSLKLSDKGLFDGKNFKFVDLYVE